MPAEIPDLGSEDRDFVAALSGNAREMEMLCLSRQTNPSRFGHQINHHASSTGAAIFSAVCSLPAMGIAIGLNGTIVDANRSRRSISEAG